MKFPLYLPQINNPQNDGLSVLAADVGGTKTNIAKRRNYHINLEYT